MPRPAAQPVLLGDPGSAEQLAEVSGLAQLGAATVGGVGLLVSAFVVLAPAASRPTGFHPLAMAVVSAAIVAAAALGARWPALFGPRVLAFLLPISVPALAGIALLAGPELSPLVTMFFVWFGSTVTFLPRRTAVVLLVWVAVVLAAFLAVQRGNIEPLVRWEGIMAITGYLAVATNRLVDRAWTLARAERDARGDAERARAALEVASAEKTRFLARMSHELRTPLNAIIGFSEVLARRSFGDLNAKQAEYVEDVVESGRHLLDLVGDLLDLAKVESGTVELDIGDIDVAGLLEGGLGLFSEQAGRRRVTLRLDVDTGIGAIEADARKLKQVLFNLVANAVRFTPPGGTVTVASRRWGENVRISVSDTGPGIPADEHDAIFEEFRQGSRGETKGGTGLGLPMARRLVVLHAGRLWVESIPGAGATFIAEIPCHPKGSAPGSRTPRPVAGPAERLFLGEPDSPERRVENARLILALGWFVVPLMLTLFPAFRWHPPPSALDFDARLFGLSSVISIGLLVGLAVRPQWMGAPRVVPNVAAFGVLVMTIGLYGLGPTFGDVGWAYLIAVVGVFVCLSRWQLLGMLALVGACDGMILALHGGWTLPAARWLADLTFVAVSAVMLRRFVARIEALAAAEREARSEAEQAAAELAAASRHKSEFLANMSHELRTPLNVIIGFSEVLESQAFGPLNEKQAEYVADVLASGRNLLALINDILDLAKIDAGRMELEVSDIDLAELLAGALRPFQAEAAERGIDLRLESGDDLGMLVGDESKLAQGLRRLLSNSVRSTPDGGSVRLSAARNEGQVVIAVRDSGAGIDAFDQGLALARRYAELHGGTLDVTDCDRGVAFILCLPTSPVPVEAAGVTA